MAELPVPEGPSKFEHRLSASYFHGGDPDVSVVVPTHARAGLWHELIAALEAQSFGPGRFEVVVVDDYSEDETWATLEKASELASLRLLCVRLPSNVGAGSARTVGLAHCRAPIVAFTDDDCLPSSEWLEHLCAPLLEGGPGGAPPVVVQGRTVPPPQDEAAGGPWIRSLWVERATWLFETCNIAYPKAELVAVGGFPSRDETPPSPSGRQVGEDALAGLRVMESGARLIFEPRALVYHRVSPSNFASWVWDERGRAVFPALVARSRLARRAMWGRWFLTPRSAATALAVASLSAWAVWGRKTFGLGLVPWVILAYPAARVLPGRPLLWRLAQIGVADLVGLSATTWASLRHRALVL